jgi:hypothetical protein
MSHIRSLTVEPLRVSPAEAVVVVRVDLVRPFDPVEVRARLVGPKCEGRTTVEVAYPLTQAPGLVPIFSAVIPEPNLWTPDAPFRYDGRVEVWADGRRVEVREFAVELRAK